MQIQYSINIRETFCSLKIKSSEKQKCIYILFLGKSRILFRLNHRITENLQNFSTKFAISTSGLNFKELKIANFLMTILQIFCNSVIQYL